MLNVIMIFQIKVEKGHHIIKIKTKFIMIVKNIKI